MLNTNIIISQKSHFDNYGGSKTKKKRLIKGIFILKIL